MSEIRFTCTKCGDCCRQKDMLITVTGRDIVRISRALHLDSGALLKALDFYLLSDGQDPPPGLEEIPVVSTERGMAYLALKKLEDGSCVFLKDNKCMIHTFRPGVCRAFPFTFSQGPDGLQWGLSAKKHICPGLGEGAVVTAKELRDTGLSMTEDLLLYKEFVQDWKIQTNTPSVTDLIDAILSDVRFTA